MEFLAIKDKDFIWVDGTPSYTQDYKSASKIFNICYYHKHTIIYDEEKLFLHKDLSIDWVDVAIEVISLTPLARGVRIVLNTGKWGLRLLRGNANISKKARDLL